MARIGRNTLVRVLGGTVIINPMQSDMDLVERKLDNIQQRGKDLSEPLAQYGVFILQAIDKTFRAQGRPAWQPLAPSTIADRLREGYGAGPILQRDGSLRRGFKTTVRRRSLQLTNSMSYFPYHQYGGRDGRPPKRPMVVILRGHRARLTELIREHVGVEE